METLIESFFSNADGTLPLKILAVIFTVGFAIIGYQLYKIHLESWKDGAPIKSVSESSSMEIKVVTTITTTIVTEIK